MTQIKSAADVNAVLAKDRVLIYKHSFRCNISDDAMYEMRAYLEDTDVETWWVDVVADRDLSMDIAQRLGVRHQSPQVLLVENGRAVWNESHWRITVDELRVKVGH